MKRLLLWLSVFFITGIYLASSLSCKGVIIIFFMIMSAFIFRTLKAKQERFSAIPFVLLIFFMAGILVFNFANNLSHKKLNRFTDKYVDVSAEAIQAPEVRQEDGYYSLEAKILTLSYMEKTYKINEKVRIYSYNLEKIPEFGDTFKMNCKITLPRDEMNSGGFDNSIHFKSKGIFFTAQLGASSPEITGRKRQNLLDKIYLLRLHLTKEIKSLIPGEEGVLLSAVLFGDKAGISEELLNSFMESGSIHMIVVSGFHFTYLISALYIFLNLFRIRKRYVEAAAGIFVLFLMAITGFTPSVLRAGIMVLLAILANMLLRQADSLTSLAFSAMVIIFLNPLSVFDVGFMLSYSSTVAIIIFADKTYKRIKPKQPNKLVKAVLLAASASASAMLGTSLIAAYYFHYFTIWSLFTAILLTPVISVILGGGMVLCVSILFAKFLAMPVAGFLFTFLRLMIWIIKLFANIPFGSFLIGRVSYYEIMVYGVIIMTYYFWTYKRGRKLVILSAILFVCIFVSGCVTEAVMHGNENQARVTFINVGQGDSAVIQNGYIDILVDGGGSYEGKKKDTVGKNILKPYLLSRNIRNIEYVIATHPHADHIRGLIGMLEDIKIERLLVPIGFDCNNLGRQLLEKAREKKAEIIYVKSGDSFDVGKNAKINFLMPTREFVDTVDDNENNISLIFAFEYGKNKFLFAGDAEKEEEEYLLEHIKPQFLKADVLKIGHHGSQTSSTDEFLDAVSPKYGVISVGENNMYNLPSQKVLDRLNKHKIEVKRTDKDKDITFYLDLNSIVSVK